MQIAENRQDFRTGVINIVRTNVTKRRTVDNAAKMQDAVIGLIMMRSWREIVSPRFCLSDVCKILGLPQVAKVVQRLGDEVLSRHPIIDNLGREQQMYFVNEDGLYDVILDSRKLEAKKFRKWVTSEVIPSIRKTGMYINPNAPINPDLLIKIGNEMKALMNQRDEFKALAAERQDTINELKPKADYCEKILQSPEALNVTVIAKDYGMGGAMFNQLRYSLKIQYPVGKTWVLYQEHVGKGYTVTETTIMKNGGSATQMKWTQKGRMFLYYELKKHNKLPLCERESPMSTLFEASA